MTPLKLTISGLYSYKTTQTIDFSKLTKSKLFGIFGNVGSGKSSILEAITFALYGETERLSKQDMRGYNMMNLQSNEMSIDFEFINNTFNNRYRFTVQTKRSKTDNSVIRAPKRVAYQLIKNEWKALETTNAEDIIGINYQNFKRTVIIPQGRFMEFLQLKPAERTKMLKELFNLHKYELFPQAVKLESENNANLNNLQGAINQIGQVDADEISEQKSKIDQTELIKKKTEKELENIESQFQIQDKLKVISERRDALIREHKSLLNQEGEIKQKEKLVTEYEYCDKTFRKRFEETNTLQSKEQEYKKQAELLQVSISVNENKLESINKIFTSLQSTAQTFDLKKDTIQDLQSIISIQEIEHQETFLSNRLKKGEIETKKLKTEIEHTSSLIKEQKKELKQLPSIRDNINTCLSNKAVLQEYHALDKALQSKKNAIVTLEREIAEKSKIANSILKKLKISPGSDLTFFNSLIEEHRNLLQTKEEEYEDKLFLQSTSNISKELKEGKPCPVCGSKEHPQIADESDFSEKKQFHIDEIKKLRQYIEELQHEKASWVQLKHSIDEKNAQRSLLDKELHSETIERNNVLGKIKGPVLPLKTVDSSITEYLKKEEQLTSLENTNSNLQEELEKLRSNEQKYTNEIQKIKNEALILQTRRKSFENSIKQINIVNYKSKPKDALEEEIADITRNIESTKKELEKTEEKKQNINSVISNDKGQLTSIKTQLKNTAKELTIKQDEISSLLSQSDYKNIDSIKDILNKNISIESEKNIILEFHTKLTSISERLAELNSQFTSINYDENLYRSLIEKRHKLKDEITSQIAQLTTLKVKYEDLLKRQRDLKVLNEQFKEKQKRGENIKTIKDLFKGSGFVNYASTVYLKNLCNLANKRFYSLTQQKLKLELGADNSFWVRDYLNNGELRSVKTLSGGQSFQAALSLALALSDSIQLHNNYTQNFFFLDEGFGSQDEESLAMIFDTFSALRAENKIVGIISHVDTLKENIGSYIEVKNTEDLGSVIYK